MSIFVPLISMISADTGKTANKLRRREREREREREFLHRGLHFFFRISCVIYSVLFLYATIFCFYRLIRHRMVGALTPVLYWKSRDAGKTKRKGSDPGTINFYALTPGFMEFTFKIILTKHMAEILCWHWGSLILNFFIVYKIKRIRL